MLRESTPGAVLCCAVLCCAVVASVCSIYSRVAVLQAGWDQGPVTPVTTTGEVLLPLPMLSHTLWLHVAERTGRIG